MQKSSVNFLLPQTAQKQQKHLLIAILFLGFIVRLGLAVVTEGYHYDTSCFFAWGYRIAEIGPSNFYAEDYFCDYPPGYMYILTLIAQVLNLFEINYTEQSARFVLTFIPSLMDMCLTYLVYLIAEKNSTAKLALRFAAFMAFCPAFLYGTAVWKQIDGVIALFVLACFYALSNKSYLLAALFYGISLAVKPQALILGPVLAIGFLYPLITAKQTKERIIAIKNGALGVLVAIAPAVITGIPFFGIKDIIPSLYEKYFTTVSSSPYATINAFNFMAAMGGNWVSQTSSFNLKIFGFDIPLFLTWEQMGNLFIVLLTVALIILAIKGAKNGRFSVLLFSAFYMIGIFTFACRMRERYLLLGIVLLIGAAAQYASPRLFALASAFSLTALINMAVVYSVLDTDDNFLTSATSVTIMQSTGLIVTILFGILCFEIWKICKGEEIKTFDKKVLDSTVQTTLNKPKEQPKWSKKEIVFVVSLTALVAILSFSYLGDLTAPQNVMRVTDGTYTESVAVSGEATKMWIYTGVVKHDATLSVTDEQGAEVLNVSLAQGGLFQWLIHDITSSSLYNVTVKNAEIMEIGFRDASGNLLELTPVGSITNGTVSEGGAFEDRLGGMFDEQVLIPQTASQLNSFYFDEIYHARTAYESLEHLQIYETTHPPMGKNFIAMGIAIFGMTGFGWRFAGTLFGVLLVPLLYLFTRRLTRSAKLAGFTAILISVDFMRFSQTRIATIDTYAAFFILASALCMLWYTQKMLNDGVQKAWLPMALCGLAFGFGVACKWTGLYAGIGLATVYFAVLYQRYCQYKSSIEIAKAPQKPKMTQPAKQKKKQKKGNDKVVLNESSTTGKSYGIITALDMQDYKKEFIFAIVGGVMFFVIVPFIIYVASYLPYRLHDPNFGLTEWWNNQLSMFNYHSELDATHPFSSVWYSWPFTLRPVWYYMGSGVAEGMYASIAGLFNPIVVWAGIAAWLRLCYKAIIGKSTKQDILIIIFFLSQFLPWMLVTRCTFLYHYFPCLVFTIVPIALWLQDISKTDKKFANFLGIGVLTLSTAFFIWFYPVLSGLPVGETWAKSLHILDSFGFYIFS